MRWQPRIDNVDKCAVTLGKSGYANPTGKSLRGRGFGRAHMECLVLSRASCQSKARRRCDTAELLPSEQRAWHVGHQWMLLLPREPVEPWASYAVSVGGAHPSNLVDVVQYKGQHILAPQFIRTPLSLFKSSVSSRRKESCFPSFPSSLFSWHRRLLRVSYPSAVALLTREVL